jgi:hypothetical protein
VRVVVAAKTTSCSGTGQAASRSMNGVRTLEKKMMALGLPSWVATAWAKRARGRPSADRTEPDAVALAARRRTAVRAR